MDFLLFYSTRYPCSITVSVREYTSVYPALEDCAGAAIRLAGIENTGSRQHFRFTDKTARAHSFPRNPYITHAHIVVDAKRLDE